MHPPPGNHYFFTVIVVDHFGNWDYKVMEFDTLKRVVTIDFPEVIVNNDGDESHSGQAEFWFYIYEGPDVVKTFNRPTGVVDDLDEAGRPYPLANPDGSPFHHVIGPQKAVKGQDHVAVHIHGRECDEWPEEDEIARMPFESSLSIPHGRFAEVVNNRVLFFRCSTGGINDFNFSAKVVFSVNYVP